MNCRFCKAIIHFIRRKLVRPEKEPATELAKRLSLIRKHFGDDRATFAKRLGIAESTYAGWERGKNKSQATAFSCFYEVLKINLTWLITGEGAMFAESAAARTVSEEDVDLDRLTAAIETVEKALCKTEQKPKPKKQAELIRIAYVMLKEEADQNNIIRLIETMFPDR